jgi:Protein of unknown function (DUF3616)
MLKLLVFAKCLVTGRLVYFHKTMADTANVFARAAALAGAALMLSLIFGDMDVSEAAAKAEIAYRVEGDFAGKKPGKPAKDLSGIACMPAAADGSRVCLAVNDESRQAQFAIIKDTTLTPGATIDLVGDEPGDAILGAPPEANCPEGEGEFGEFDGEAVAYAEPYFYVLGSHGCGRRNGQFKLSSFLLARIKVDGAGRPVDTSGKALPEARWSEAVELTYRLSDMLRSASTVGGFFGASLDEEANGLNIEGVAIDGTRLLAGLRAPCLDGKAFLVSADLKSLFAPGNDPADDEPAIIPLALGEETGIRDLASLPDGRLVVLAGPAQDQELPYKVLIAEPREGGAITEIGTIAPVTDDKGRPAKAEAVAILAADAKELRLLVLFDGLRNGGPIERRFRMP